MIARMSGVLVLLAVASAVPGASPAGGDARRVVLRRDPFEARADRAEGRWDPSGTVRLLLGADAGKTVELRMDPPREGEKTKGSRHLGDGIRIVAAALAVETKPERADGGFPAMEAKGDVRVRGRTFSFACDRIVYTPSGKRIEIEGAQDLVLDLHEERRLPPIRYAWDRLQVSLDGFDIPEVREAVFANPAGFEATVDGAQLRLTRLVLKLER